MATDYEVTTIRSASVINARGELVDMYEVFATTSLGDSFVVRIAKGLSETEARAEVEKEAKKLIAIRSL